MNRFRHVFYFIYLKYLLLKQWVRLNNYIIITGLPKDRLQTKSHAPKDIDSAWETKTIFERKKQRKKMISYTEIPPRRSKRKKMGEFVFLKFGN